MIKINEDKIIADGLEKDLSNINVINLSNKYLSFSSRIADCVKYEGDIESFYKKITNAGLNGYLLLGNNVINLNNVVSLHIEYYQYAGISIHKCSPEHAEMYLLTIECQNGKKETISFRTNKEAEQCYKEINSAFKQLKIDEATKSV